MTKKQFLRAAKAIANGCKARKTLANMYGERCAVGELMHEVGFTDKQFMGRGGPWTDEVTKLEQELGVTNTTIGFLMKANDEERDLCKRRKRVIGILKRQVTDEPTEKGQNEQTTVQ